MPHASKSAKTRAVNGTSPRSRAVNGHNAEARAATATTRWRPATPQPRDLAHAAPPVHGHVWQPVQGPHLRPVRKRDSRSRTGVVGISYGIRRYRRKTMPEPLVRRFYFVQLGRDSSASFCLDTLGEREAWRRAVRARAEHELKVRRANAAILAAREKGAAA